MVDGPYRDGKVHVLSKQCETCIFRPGGIDLAPGRRKEVVQANIDNDAAVTCHETLPYSGTGAKPSVCRGFFDRFKTKPLAMAVHLDMIDYDEPPTNFRKGYRA